MSILSVYDFKADAVIALLNCALVINLYDFSKIAVEATFPDFKLLYLGIFFSITILGINQSLDNLEQKICINSSIENNVSSSTESAKSLNTNRFTLIFLNKPLKNVFIAFLASLSKPSFGIQSINQAE